MPTHLPEQGRAATGSDSLSPSDSVTGGPARPTDRWGYSSPGGTHRWTWGPFLIVKVYTEPLASFDMYLLGTFIGCKYDLDTAKLRCECLAEACAEALS